MNTMAVTLAVHARTPEHVTDCIALHAAYRDLFDAIDGVTLNNTVQMMWLTQFKKTPETLKNFIDHVSQLYY